MSKQAKLSVGAEQALATLKEHGPMTLAEMKEILPDVNSSHLTALRNRGLVESEQVEIEIETVVKRKVNSYTAVETDETEATE